MEFEEEQNDQFQRLPDDLLPLIFNKLHDAQSLTRCMLVSKRFASKVPQVHNLSLTIRPRKQFYHQITKSSNRRSKSFLKNLIRKVITRPLQFLVRIITLKSSSSLPDCSYYLPNEVLKNFKEIQFLRIQLPGLGGEIGSNGVDSLLSWRAEFGSELKSCVILGAKSQTPKNGEEIDENDQDLLLSDNELKLRVMWTITCLIAASARHSLLKQVVSEHEMLRSMVIEDGSRQGRVCMRREHIEELRSTDVNSSAPSERTPVPALKVKLSYVPVLELPASGCVMKGATLLVVRPVDGTKKAERDGDLVERVCNGAKEEEEEKVFCEAVRELMKKEKTYTLEINSF